MMAIIDIDRMYKEILGTMENNFEGTPSDRFIQARIMYLKSIDATIEANREDIIADFERL